MKRTRSQDIIDAAARAAFVSAWADYQEERGRHLRGELMDQALATPTAAKKWARSLFAAMAKMNRKSVERMYEHAAGDDQSARTRKDFGHYTATQALGHGVGWSDDYPDHGLRIPHAEFHMDGARSFFAEVSKRRGISR